MTGETLTSSTSSITLPSSHGPPRLSVPSATSPIHGTSPGHQRSSFAIHELLGLGRQEQQKSREFIPSRPLISPLMAAAAAGHPAMASVASCIPGFHPSTASLYFAAAKASVGYDHAALAALAMHSSFVQQARSPTGLPPLADSRNGKTNFKLITFIITLNIIFNFLLTLSRPFPAKLGGKIGMLCKTLSFKSMIKY